MSEAKRLRICAPGEQLAPVEAPATAGAHMAVEERERLAAKLDQAKAAILGGTAVALGVVLVGAEGVESAWAAPGAQGLAGLLLGLQAVSQQLLLLSISE